VDYGVWGTRGVPNRIRGGGGWFLRPQNFTYGVGLRITKYMVSNCAYLLQGEVYVYSICAVGQ